MLDSILNKIAERSQALKDKDAEIKALKEVGGSFEDRVSALVAQLEGKDARIKEVTDSRERAYDVQRESNRRADEAEDKLLKIATALDITEELADMAPKAEAVDEVAEVEAMMRSDMGGVDKLREVIKADYEIASADEPDAVEEAEEPAPEA